ncbi:MAG: type VI secretion system ImpA family N-terminal domain-containing protein, partial [Thalassolituus sp.]
MSFSHVVDIERLIAPISEDTPQGSDIREDRSPTSDFYTIKDARNAARAAERSAVFGEDDAVDLIGPWETVSSVAQRVLSDTSKDLEVAAWY